MGLSALDAALGGLRVSQQQINVISQNVSNVGTPGYSRKILPQSSESVNGVTIGVRTETLIRQVDINLESDLWTQESATAFYDVQSSYLSQIEQFHGPPEAELSVAAELSRLRDGFISLSDSPESISLQANAVGEAVDFSDKVNDLSSLISTLRNDAQDEIRTTVSEINALLENIAQLNKEIRSQLNLSRSTASTEDQRSNAIGELSTLIDISFFQRGDGVIVVQTGEGRELVNEDANVLTFQSQPLSAANYYPESAGGIILGDPNVERNTVDITERELGGTLGGLVELRDTIFPKQMAQLDELAHKTARRFEAQGLRLFTDETGAVPLDTAPTPEIPGPIQAVDYVGFSAVIRVNQAVLNDNTLIQRGTFGAVTESGSTDVIQRVLDNTFGAVDFQQAIGQIDLRVSGNAPPNNTLQDFLGLRSESEVSGGINLTPSGGYNSLADLLAAGGEDAFGLAPNETDNLTITFSDPDFGGTYDIELDLSAIAALPTSGSAAQDIINAINADPDFANAVTDFGATATIGANGQLVINSRSDVTIAAGLVDPLSDLGFAFLGLATGTTEAEDPLFDIFVANNAPTTITLEPTDTEVELLAKLQVVPGLAVEDITIGVDGFLRLRPGNDFTDPQFGGDITIIAGTQRTDTAGANVVVAPNTVPDSINIVSALFGSFSGTPAQDGEVVSDVFYGSETDATFTPPIPTVSFRTDLLGPSVNVTTGVLDSTTLLDHAQKMINQQTQEQIVIAERGADEATMRDILQQQLTDESGVNLDEELGLLIVVQTAYAASARVVSAVDELFTELLNAVR